jgi:acetate---CoA ligase (ADP-forming)
MRGAWIAPMPRPRGSRSLTGDRDMQRSETPVYEREPAIAGRVATPQIADGYPSVYEVDIALRDGSTIHVRPVTRADGPAMLAFLRGLSPESIGLRFFGRVNLDWVTQWSTDVDYDDKFGLVATAGPDRAIVAHAAYVRSGPERAEMAFVVADGWQERGIATIMLAHLARAAEEHGVKLFTADVLPRNARMIRMFSESGFPVALQACEGTIRVELATSRSQQVRERFEQRERTAAVAAVRRFLEPRSVAVIGASRRRGTVGGEILRNLYEGGFSGAIHPVNSSAASVQGHHAHASILDIGADVDLAVIAVPAERVCAAARECAEAGVRALLVISAGFAEAGPAGLARQRELLVICRSAGMRLVGPNCFGVLNTAEDVRLNATFAAHPPPPGRIGFLSQSGGLGIAIIEAADRIGLGLSSFVSVGNKSDISGNDLLEYWEDDAATAVALLYLESFGNARRFARIARRVGRSKPIVALKSGRSPAGARATSSHTGALVAASDVTVDALFRQAGVIRTDTMHELFDVGALLSCQPAPRGNRVAIVTNAGGPGILCADACQEAGLDVVAFPEEVRDRLAAVLPSGATVGNPIDMIATAPAESYRHAIDALVQTQACDAIVAIFVPPLVTRAEDVARELHAAATGMDAVALATVFMNKEGLPAQAGTSTRLVSFDFPEDAARALGHAARYARWRERPSGTVTEYADVEPEEATAIIAEALADGGGWLDAERLAALFRCYGLPLIPSRVAHGPDEAGTIARELGLPVAMKALAGGLVHKSDIGAVRLGLDSDDAVAGAARDIERAVSDAGHRLDGLLLQPMAEPGVELLMGVVHDETFGAVIACGAGGTSAEVVGDVAVRITPLSDLDADEMLRSLRTFPLLDGYRGAPRCDLPAVTDVLLRLNALVDAHPEIAELDANPVVAGPHGAVIVDARVRLEPAVPQPPLPSLRWGV